MGAYFGSLLGFCPGMRSSLTERGRPQSTSSPITRFTGLWPPHVRPFERLRCAVFSFR